jgi:anti-sigma-K factor RskA
VSALKLSRDEARDLFGAYALGGLSDGESEAVREAVAGWPEGEAELQELMATAGVLPLVPEDSARPSIALEGRIIAEARKARSASQFAARAQQGAMWWRRHLPHSIAAVFAVVAIAMAVLWIGEDAPIAEGRWLPLETQVSEEPGGWVYVTDYVRMPVSLLFWEAEPPAEGTSYQLFRILESGETVPDLVFRLPGDGTGVIQIERQPELKLAGFAVVLIEGEEPLRGTPSADSVVFTFPAR